MVDIKTGRIHRHWNKEPVKRPEGAPTPCHDCAKCSGSVEKSPEIGRQAELSQKNQRTLELYYQHRAAGIEGIDDVTRHNFGLILQTIESFDRHLRRQTNSLLGTVLAIKRVR
jgi:hypothetical protein